MQSVLGSDVARTTPGTQHITLGFQPKFVLFLTSTDTADTTLANHNLLSFGIANGTNQIQLYLFDENNVAYNLGKTGMGTTTVMVWQTSHTAIEGNASVQSFDATGFTLNYGFGLPNAYRFHYLAFEGDEITNVTIDSESVATFTDHIFLGYIPKTLYGMTAWIDGSAATGLMNVSQGMQGYFGSVPDSLGGIQTLYRDTAHFGSIGSQANQQVMQNNPSNMTVPISYAAAINVSPDSVDGFEVVLNVVSGTPPFTAPVYGYVAINGDETYISASPTMRSSAVDATYNVVSKDRILPVGGIVISAWHATNNADDDWQIGFVDSALNQVCYYGQSHQSAGNLVAKHGVITGYVSALRGTSSYDKLITVDQWINRGAIVTSTGPAGNTHNGGMTMNLFGTKFSSGSQVVVV